MKIWQMQLHTLTATLLTTGQHIAHISQSSLPSLTHLIDTPTSQMLDFSVAPPSTPKTTRVLLFWSAGGASLRQDVWRERGWVMRKAGIILRLWPHPHQHTHSTPSSFCRLAWGCWGGGSHNNTTYLQADTDPLHSAVVTFTAWHTHTDIWGMSAAVTVFDVNGYYHWP